MKRLILALAIAMVASAANARPWPVPADGPNVETRWVQHNKHIPLIKKLNPIWWFLNDDQQRVDQAPWYEPTWPEWERILVWNMFRNPMQNFRSYVIGVQDKSFYVTAKKPWGTIQRNDLCNRNPKTGAIISCQTGYQWHWLWGGDLLFPLPFVSYSGKNVVWYAGWQPGGFAGTKLNLHSSACGNPNNYSATC